MEIAATASSRSKAAPSEPNASGNIARTAAVATPRPPVSLRHRMADGTDPMLAAGDRPSHPPCRIAATHDQPLHLTSEFLTEPAARPLPRRIGNLGQAERPQRLNRLADASRRIAQMVAASASAARRGSMRDGHRVSPLFALGPRSVTVVPFSC